MGEIKPNETEPVNLRNFKNIQHFKHQDLQSGWIFYFCFWAKAQTELEFHFK